MLDAIAGDVCCAPQEGARHLPTHLARNAAPATPAPAYGYAETLKPAPDRAIVVADAREQGLDNTSIWRRLQMWRGNGDT